MDLMEICNQMVESISPALSTFFVKFAIAVNVLLYATVITGTISAIILS